MRLGPVFNQLHEAVGAATYRDIPDIVYSDRDWEAWKKMSKEQQTESMKNHTVPSISKSRRPNSHDIEVYVFAQTWGSTACGYGGMGGAAMTTVYTVVVECRGHYCVYFGCGRLAYRVSSEATTEGRDVFLKDLHNFNLSDVRGSSKYR